MNSILDDDDDSLEPKDREVTLSSGMILGIFFGLVLLCGLFFGFGYKMGSHTAAPPMAASSPETATPATETFSGFKPAPGSPVSSRAESSANSAGSGAVKPVAEGESGSSKRSAVGAPTAGVGAESTRAVAPVVTTPEPAVAAGSFVVQVAAVSHEEDAQLLVSALRTKGYPVSAHTEPQDKFFHVQVGPFTNIKDANAAKQRLLADGYQPIVK